MEGQQAGGLKQSVVWLHCLNRPMAEPQRVTRLGLEPVLQVWQEGAEAIPESEGVAHQISVRFLFGKTARAIVMSNQCFGSCLSCSILFLAQRLLPSIEALKALLIW